MIDGALKHELWQDQSHDRFFCAHMDLSILPGAGAFLTAPLVDDGREFDSPLFQVALKRRLRAPLFESDGPCQLCGEVMDRWGDHALTCSCGGDRTIRHNAVRNICYEEALDAGLRPEREKAGLLPGRPVADGMPVIGNGRRPADVWLPRGPNGKGEALDFAVSSGMQSELFQSSAETPGLVFHRYEELKRNFKDIAASCEVAGFQFTPLVVEAHGGGWSPGTRHIFDFIAATQAACHHEVPASVSLKIAQRISCTLHKENARAILRRSAAPAAPPFLPSGWDDAAQT